ncbi:FAD-dependent oxidoreductase [Wenzhouxiangella sp. XN201]|uniref:flavin monoamine oxidase family protein n=1 Tax=Wenzhouxiangella sp. XN201 TaxID=2710755 RepID=UPI0013C75052|nr:NAD(P)/FAD-dependent oxidoreductase [Wenzhouxiangella sp. XN201]NEZ04321.1 FAD-dependent oxidoreductase [Wenzhouxiangella sp. XN201]
MKQAKITIIGAGVSGLYAAWRLLEAGHDSASLTVLEATDRIGGRLWSLRMQPDSTLPAELGGMFFNDRQPLVYGLCSRALDLPKEPVAPEPDFAWLRATRFRIAEFADPKKQPYNLAPDEQGLSYYQLLDLACTRIAPDIKKLWPNDPDGSREQTLDYLKQHEFDGRPLWRWGFWNLLSRVISNEAWLALRGMISSNALLSNWNGFDAMVAVVVEQSGQWFRLTHGYQHLPERLAEVLEQAGVAVLKGHVVERVERDGKGLRLMVDSKEGTSAVGTDRLVLAVPKLALSALVDASPDLRQGGLTTTMDSVDSVPNCKIFLTFDKPWWRDVPDGPGRIGRGSYGVSHTDLPMRQCYYLGVDKGSGQALMLASYPDTDAVSFWRALTPDSGRGAELASDLSPVALTEIRRELSEMHGVDVPQPTAGRFIDWTHWPYGGGWHNWLPGWKSWEVTESMCAPITGLPVHLCGETYSTAQGWVEGALQTTEDMLQRCFHLSAPDWLNS